MYLAHLVAVFLLSVVAIAVPVNPLIPVHLRIEGERRTIFEGTVLTRGHDVTTPSGGTHRCNGLNNHTNPLPGATCTSALADAAQQHKFTFDGTFDREFDDFFITAIAGEVQTDTKFWGILRNFRFIPVGGCQQEVNSIDDVLFAWDAFSKKHFLKLSGPNTAQVGKSTKFTVTDGSSGAPIEGASVDGHKSARDGIVTIVFEEKGMISLKATKFNSTRSNAVDVTVV